MNRIKKILQRYKKGNYKIFHDTIDTLCADGIGNGVYQDYSVLVDVLSILTVCENIIENKENTEN